MFERLKVVIAEDHFLMREGTSRVLAETGEVDVMAAVDSVPALLDVVARVSVDAVVTDIRMPPTYGLEGIAAAHEIRRRHPGTGVVVLSQHADESYAFELFREGTEGLAYLLKDRVTDVDELLVALRATHAGRSVVDAKVVEALVARRTRHERSPLARLTSRELDVLREMAQGRGNAGIAHALSLSESSVEKYVNAIFSKLGVSLEAQVHRRVAAVLAFLRHADTLDEETVRP